MPRKTTFVTNPEITLGSLRDTFCEETKTSLPTRSYFIETNKKYKGRPKTTLPTVINRDLALINHPIRLNKIRDLDNITKLAQDRKNWRELTTRIERAAEASQTENWDARRP